MKLVVTGAGEAVAARVIEIARAAGHQVVTFDLDLAQEGAEATLAPYLGPDVVLVHLAERRPAAVTELAELRSLVDENVHATLRALDACRAAGALRVVFGSSDELEDEDRRDEASPVATSEYAATKAAGEDHVRSFADEEQVDAIAVRSVRPDGPELTNAMAGMIFFAATTSRDDLLAPGRRFAVLRRSLKRGSEDARGA